MSRLGTIITAFETVGLAIGVLVTPLAAFVTVVAYPQGAVSAILLGLAAAIIGAALLIWLYRHPAKASEAFPDEYIDIRRRLQSARNLMNSMGTSPNFDEHVYGTYDPQPTRRPVEAANAAWLDAKKCDSDLEAELTATNIQWNAGSPYLRAWKHLYGMEEALICCMPHELVVSGITNDIGRLDGSDILRRAQLTQALKDAQTQLGGPPPRPVIARSTARSVRKAINGYRADQWDAIVRNRNLTMLATGFAAVGAYGLLVLITAYGRIPFAVIVAATVFLAVGGVVGLTHQVYSQVGQQSVVEDFGLSVARLLANPLVSGLVALIAVATFGMVGLKINDAVVVKPLTTWNQVFNFSTNSGALVVAVLFGFAPSLFFQWLQARGDQLQKNLKNTQSTGSGSP